TYVTERGGTTIRLAQARHARWEAIAGIAVHLLWPVFSMLPLLALGLWFGIDATSTGSRLFAFLRFRPDAIARSGRSLAPMPNHMPSASSGSIVNPVHSR
ncbi:hypothetical protein QM326_38965, partial [Burkholderia cenocepacia]|nr:hypothetical protein [Burkholderia cenocepacia]